MANRNSGRRSLVLVAALMLVAVGVLVGQLAFPPKPPEDLANPQARDSFAVTAAEFDNSRTVEVLARFGATTELVSNTDGMVTESFCVPGKSIDSGAKLAAINGEEIMALATTVPLWRPLSNGDTGGDVDTLRAELVRLGHELTEARAVDEQLLRAFWKQLTGTESTAAIAAERIVWLPESSVSPRDCVAQVGTRITAGERIATTVGALVELSVNNAATGRATQAPEQLTVAGVSVPLEDGDRVVSEESLHAVMASGSVSSPSEQEDTGENTVTISGTVSLYDAISAYSVPPAAVFGVSEGDAGTRACLNSAGSPLAISVLGSQFGTTYFQPVDDGAQVPQLVNAPTSKLQCNPDA